MAFSGVKFLILSRSRFVGRRYVVPLMSTDLGVLNFGFAVDRELRRLLLRGAFGEFDKFESGEDVPQPPTSLHWCERGNFLFAVFAMMNKV